MKLKNVLLTQQTTSDCGVTTLRMLLAYVHKERAYLTHKLPGKLDNFAALSNVSQKYGVTLKGYKVNEGGLLKEIKAPFIAQLTRSGVNHFVVCHVRKRKLHINDPSGDHYVLPLKDNEKYFISNILVVNSVENVVKPLKPNLPINYVLISLQLAFLLSITVGFLFLGHASLDLLSYIAFTLAALLKISEQHMLLKVVARFDYRFTRNFLTLPHKDFKNDYTRFQQAKVTLISEPLAIFNAITTILFMSVLLILNNMLLLIICVFIIVLSLIFNRQTFTKGVKLWNLVNLEANLVTSNEANRVNIYETIMIKSDEIAKSTVYATIIIHFVLGILIFVLMYFSETYTLNFFLFYFFGFAYYYSELKKLFALVTNRARYYAAINTIIN